MRRVAFLALLGMFLLAGCQAEISRSRWESMDARSKVLTVDSLKGHEAALESKGGQSRRSYSRPTREYVEAIDRRYREGDHRSVNRVFDDLADQERPEAPPR